MDLLWVSGSHCLMSSPGWHRAYMLLLIWERLRVPNLVPMSLVWQCGVAFEYTHCIFVVLSTCVYWQIVSELSVIWWMQMIQWLTISWERWCSYCMLFVVQFLFHEIDCCALCTADDMMMWWFLLCTCNVTYHVYHQCIKCFFMCCWIKLILYTCITEGHTTGQMRSDTN